MPKQSYTDGTEIVISDFPCIILRQQFNHAMQTSTITIKQNRGEKKMRKKKEIEKQLQLENEAIKYHRERKDSEMITTTSGMIMALEWVLEQRGCISEPD